MSDFGVAVVRGWVTTCVALVLGLWCAPVFAQTTLPSLGEPPTLSSAPTQGSVYPPTSASPHTAYQSQIQELGPPQSRDMTIPPGAAVTTPKAKPRVIRVAPRYGISSKINYDSLILPDGVRRTVFTGGWIINVTGDTPQDDIELAADEGVIWDRGMDMDAKFQPEGSSPSNGTKQTEFYLSGRVVIRTRPKLGPLEIQTLRGSQIYYDVERERAIALSGIFEYRPLLPVPGGTSVLAPDPFRFRAEELRKLDAENYEGLNVTFNSSKLPYDPEIRVDAPKMTMTDRYVQLTNAFGLPYRQFPNIFAPPNPDVHFGDPVVGDEKIITATGAVPYLEGVPFFYFPWYRADANEPLGPFVSLGLGENQVFGAQIYTTWNLFELLGLKPEIGQRWTLEADYLSQRGPGIGTDYRYRAPPTDPESGMLGVTGLIKYYALEDHGLDDLGGYRGTEPTQPGFRDRFLWQHQQDFTPDLYFQGQLAYLSDKNFLEQYYKTEFDTGPNQETFANLIYQHDNYWVSGLFEPHIDRPWIAETSWLPRVDGALIGQSFFDRFVYSARGSAGYAENHPTTTNPVSIEPTDQQVNTGRFDLMQELAVPFGVGPVRLSPYAMLDLTGYTQDLDGNAIGRVWGGGGMRASMEASHLYEGVTSDLFNVQDLYHKMVFSANYLNAQTNVHYNQLPLLDRLNDDATDQGWRNMREMQELFVSGPAGVALQNSPIYDPQTYAIRRALLDKVDTMDDIDVLQLDLRQRLQTKRGYPGEEHEVDLVSLDTSISYFPQASRDDFGHSWAFAEWDFLWNVGDRVAVNSTGWIEPYNGGSRYWTCGVYFNRPDQTNLYIGYRQTDPLNSRAVTAAIAYQLSKRYFLTGSASYDFGIGQAMSNSLSLTRVGADLTVTFGITYNSLVNNFGVMFMIMPNMFAAVSPGMMPGMTPTNR
jgi:hypothetical protein